MGLWSRGRFARHGPRRSGQRRRSGHRRQQPEPGGGVYRNDTTAPRVGVRLKGSPPNTRGIGAKIWLYGGAVPMQSQEMICGGRYLSCDDTMRVFAAGNLTNEMRIEVKWRSGKRSVVKGVKSNRVYEVDEAGAEAKADIENRTTNIK